MSSITEVDKRYFESVLDMRRGYVLDYTDATFEEFFRKHGVSIHGARYQTYGTSKAKKLRAFWEEEDDKLVGTVLGEMLDSYEADCDINGGGPNYNTLVKCRETVLRLTGGAVPADGNRDEDFLEKEFVLPMVEKLPVEPQVAAIIATRLSEVQKVLPAGAHLSVVLLCGSILEAVLLGAAREQPAQFNRSPTSPKKQDGKPKPLHEWTLSQLIDTAHQVGLLKLDVKIFAHGLRDFRNYIHPYQQLTEDFTPDEYTSKLCFQALKAALASVAGER